jgi:hypothetical protein
VAITWNCRIHGPANERPLDRLAEGLQHGWSLEKLECAHGLSIMVAIGTKLDGDPRREERARPAVSSRGKLLASA